MPTISYSSVSFYSGHQVNRDSAHPYRQPSTARAATTTTVVVIPKNLFSAKVVRCENAGAIIHH